MSVIYRYRIVMILACLAVLSSRGICQEEDKGEITWDDIEGISSYPVGGAVQTTAPETVNKGISVVPTQKAKPEIKQGQIQGVEAVVELKKEPSQPLSEVLPAVKPKAGNKANNKEVSPRKRRRSEEENAWKRAAAITGEDPVANRDIFVTNPDRE